MRLRPSLSHGGNLSRFLPFRITEKPTNRAEMRDSVNMPVTLNLRRGGRYLSVLVNAGIAPLQVMLADRRNSEASR